MTTQPQVRERVERKHVPAYSVLLHNDDHNDMEHVIRALRSTVPSLSAERAQGIMWEAHLHGLALVTVAPQEHAEFYQEQLLSHGLTATIEPAE